MRCRWHHLALLPLVVLTDAHCLFPSLSGLAPAAGRARSALSAAGGCAHATAGISLSTAPFSVELWLRVDSPSTPSALDAIVWNGGRTKDEPGWSIDLQDTSLVFCVSDAGSGKCTPPYAVVIGDLVHVVATAPLDGATGQRTLNLYTRDLTRGDAVHTLVASVEGGNVDWGSTALFTVGGAFTGGQCTTPAHVTVDDLRILTDIIAPTAMDATESTDICGTPQLVADFAFDEGLGSTTTDCSTTARTLSLDVNTTFTPSPFP